MLRFTLDTNCIIDLDEKRRSAQSLRDLVRAHESGHAKVAVVAASASERQRGGTQIQNFQEFQNRLASLGLAKLDILKTLFYWDVGYWDWSFEVEPRLARLEQSIHDILFPSVECQWSDFCRSRGLDAEAVLKNSEWLNKKCDVLAMWSHMHYEHDIFVTSDENFHSEQKKSDLLVLGAGRIEYPEDAVALI